MSGCGNVSAGARALYKVLRHVDPVFVTDDDLGDLSTFFGRLMRKTP